MRFCYLSVSFIAVLLFVGFAVRGMKVQRTLSVIPFS